MTDAQASALLDQVNTTTNGIAAIVASDATVLGTVKTELEALLATQGQPSGISDATAAKLQTALTNLGTVQTNATSNATLLNAIAAEGANTTTIPAPPPPPANP